MDNHGKIKFIGFEEKISEYTGSKRAVVCVNGTNALYLALKLVGVEQNDEVITQPLTFIATANAISYCEAAPVFLDVVTEPELSELPPVYSWLKKAGEVDQRKNDKAPHF